MTIILNNKSEVFEAESLSIAEIITRKNFTFKLLVTKLNDRLVKKDERATTYAKNGDNVLVLHLISGG
jgi:thiamine biosynthesis protein ThiS